MAINHLIHWYQKKIGTYDKQQWEKTVEQRIFGGFTHVPMRTAKLKTEYIDVDLVRGSSFTKAKPKHGLRTVTWLALKRLLFLPLNGRWWIQQTSRYTFAFFLLLYSLQFFNIVIFFHLLNKDSESDIISTAEVLIPFAMMLTLCIVHSQIVSTHSGPSLSKSDNHRSRRSRNGRGRFNKSRVRRNLRGNNDFKSTVDNTSDKESTISVEVSSSVRFAKKVTIESAITSSPKPKLLEDVENEVAEMKVERSNSPSLVDAQSPLVEDQPEPVEEVVENGIVVHQDDDGFESLNGNVSSDNEREVIAPVIENKKENLEGKGNVVELTEQEYSLARRFSGRTTPDTSKKGGNYSDSDGDGCNSLKGREIMSDSAGSRKNVLECESEEEGECEETANIHFTEATTSATEWMGVTTNSDECSYSSEFEESDLHSESNFNCNEFVEHPFSWEFELPPSILSSCTTSDRVSCTIWTRRDIKKAELSVLDISSAIIERAESTTESMDYFYGGLILALLISLMPSIRRLTDQINTESVNNSTILELPYELSFVNMGIYVDMFCKMLDVAFGSSFWERIVILISGFERLVLSSLLFFLLAVAERTYKQRLLYAKLFSHLTSSRRARKSDLPHFRLNKVRNIKTWLSIRSYLKRRGPQRSVDVIVSSIFILTLLLLSFISLELIKDLESLHSPYSAEALFWSFALGIFVLRFMTLGTKINKKYRNLSVLITEQINLYLQIEQKPHKKDELMVANSVLKLAADLIKELESPFKISGLSANPYLYTITKVVLLSALSGILSELLGFKLKLHKIKIK
ncbi:protein phtf isoform X1 [Leptopilina heterotoma]|uniref:protein phtf isoform X1 n=1 Tax=Leptopilina heterotoma TaxID=63436 RepID=UPI001CA9B433|nr:protein phtf isoform X1 [Leptopilina heterotoma]XP_043478133.1 protein phtf isoform X1 [Leptopilina heterotoma]